MGRISLTAAHLIHAVTDGINGQTILPGMVKRLEWYVEQGFVLAELKQPTRQGARFITVPFQSFRNLSFVGPALEPEPVDEEWEAEQARQAEIAEAEAILAQTNAALARLRARGMRVDAPPPNDPRFQNGVFKGGRFVPAPLPIAQPQPAPMPPPPPDMSTRAGRLAHRKATDRLASPIGPGQVPIDAGAQARVEAIAESAPLPELDPNAEPVAAPARKRPGRKPKVQAPA